MQPNPVGAKIVCGRDREGETSRGKDRSKVLILQTDRGEITVEVQGEEPAWLQPALDQLRQLCQLRNGWNSYRARHVTPASAVAALNLLDRTMLPTTPAPSIVPTASGGVQLEWHTHGIDLEVGITPSRNVTAAYEDQVDGGEWEDELGPDLAQLANALAALSRRG